MAQGAPTLTSCRRSNDDAPQFMRAEAVAMRRLVLARGYWLSPQFATVPLPVLTAWECSVELADLDRNHTTRERQQAKYLLKNQSQYQSHKHNQLQQPTAAPQPQKPRSRNYVTPTELDVTISRTKTLATVTNLQARQAHRDNIEQVAQAQGKSPAEVEREIALARIMALAAEKSVAHVTPEARAARRLEVSRKAQAKYVASINADPARAAAKREESNRQARERKARQKADLQQPQEHAAKWTARPMPNPHRDPTIPTAKMLREEAIRAEAIEAEQRSSARKR